MKRCNPGYGSKMSKEECERASLKLGLDVKYQTATETNNNKNAPGCYTDSHGLWNNSGGEQDRCNNDDDQSCRLICKNRNNFYSVHIS